MKTISNLSLVRFIFNLNTIKKKKNKKQIKTISDILINDEGWIIFLWYENDKINSKKKILKIFLIPKFFSYFI